MKASVETFVRQPSIGLVSASCLAAALGVFLLTTYTWAEAFKAGRLAGDRDGLAALTRVITTCPAQRAPFIPGTVTIPR